MTGGFTSDRIKTNQELIQGQTKSTEEMYRLPENVKVDPKPADSMAVQALKMAGKSLSTIDTYSVNKVPLPPLNNRSSSNSLDGWRSMGMNKMVKKVKNKRGSYIRKRSWTVTKVASLIDDGHVWKKYGQKYIINAKHKRNYYRCTHKFDQGCAATKQVQQIEDEPPKYRITYNRHHTCKNFLSIPEMLLDSINHKDTSTLLSFESNGLIDKEQVGSHFPSYTNEDSKKALSSSELKDTQPSLFQFSLPNSLIVSDQWESSLISTRLEHGDMISKGVYSPIFEMDHILQTIDYRENPFDLDHCELINFYYSFRI